MDDSPPVERDNEYFTIKVDSYRVVDDYDEINKILYNYYEDLTRNKTKAKKSPLCEGRLLFLRWFELLQKFKSVHGISVGARIARP